MPTGILNKRELWELFKYNLKSQVISDADLLSRLMTKN